MAYKYPAVSESGAKVEATNLWGRNALPGTASASSKVITRSSFESEGLHYLIGRLLSDSLVDTRNGLMLREGLRSRGE